MKCYQKTINEIIEMLEDYRFANLNRLQKSYEKDH